MSDLRTTTEVLGTLIGFPTVSALSNLDMIAWLANRLEGYGARVEVLHDATETKANLFATIGPDRDGGIVLSGHSDVVPVADQDWTSDPFTALEHDGLIYGRGACDMKGFIAAAVAMAPAFAARNLSRPVHFAFTYDEEIGCFGAKALASHLTETGRQPGVVIIGEPTEMRVIEGHKGCHEFTTHFHGLPGHGSDPDRGVNAVEYAARYVGRLLELRETLRARAPAHSRFDPPWTTINTGAIIGGLAHNVIAARARVDWEMRPICAEDARLVRDDLDAYCDSVLLPAMRAICPDAAILTEVIGQVDGLEPMDACEARDLVMELTGAALAELVPFSTEGGIFQALGMSGVVCGPGSIDQAHKADEFVSLGQLNQCLGMLERLGAKLEA